MQGAAKPILSVGVAPGIYRDRYHRVELVSETGTGKLFMHGRSQAVRLPKAFRFSGTEVRVTRVGRGIMLEPKTPSLEEIRAISAELRRMAEELGPFMPEGRMQPPMPSMDEIDLDNDLP